jgi:pimeloyl-ACP methyl ester carboxylesterase
MPFARNGDVRIHYVIEGVGPPLVLHHGFTGSASDWTSFCFVAGLRDEYQLIMLDARGHGASDKPHDPARYGFAQGASDVVAVLDDLGIAQAHYYGYSYGGKMGWALGAYAPQRFASLAIGGAHPYPPSDKVQARIERMRQYLQQGMATYIAWRESQIGPWPPAFRERGLRNDAEALVAFITPEPARRPVGFNHAPACMTMPVLVLSGDDDELYAGSQARRAAGELNDGSFIEIADADHFTLYVRPDRVLPHVRAFLSHVTASRPARV